MMVVMWVATEPFSKTLYVLKMMLYSVTGASSKKITGSNRAFIHAFFFYRFYPHLWVTKADGTITNPEP